MTGDNSPLQLTAVAQSWPIAGTFTIARGSKTVAEVVVVTLERNGLAGRGECVPYGRYGETVPQVIAALDRLKPVIEAGISRSGIAGLDLPMAARNALDCALWDLEAKQTAKPVWQLAGLAPPQAITTAFTISLDTPEAMAAAACAASRRPLLKLKLGRDGDIERLIAIREAVPDNRLIIDANEGWSPAIVPDMLGRCAALGVELVEQPLPDNNDDILRELPRAILICADESAHGLGSLPGLLGKYDAINIKLDKTGGLTPAIELARAAKAQGLTVMVGCMLATSLAMAPAALIGQFASYIDLDGPLLLHKDRDDAIAYDGAIMQPPQRALWG